MLGRPADGGSVHDGKAAPGGWDAEAQPGPPGCRGGGSSEESSGRPGLELEPAKSINDSLKTDYEDEDAELHRHGGAAGQGVAGAS